jgi:hypothetical protein
MVGFGVLAGGDWSFLIDGFWCFGLEDDEGARLASSSLGIFGLSNKSNTQPYPPQQIPNRQSLKSYLKAQNFLIYWYKQGYRLFRA